MTKIIRCECGYVVTGSTDRDLLENAFAHIAEAHPAMRDVVTSETLLGMAEVVA